MLLFMETILADGMDKVSDYAQLCAKNELIDLLKSTGGDCDATIEFHNDVECGFTGNYEILNDFPYALILGFPH